MAPGLGDNIMEMKSQGLDSAPTVGWGSLPSQSSRPLTPCNVLESPVEIQTDESPMGMYTAAPRRYTGPKDPAGDRAPLKVVYVVLESQYQASMSEAVNAINANANTGIACECVGYLLEELRVDAVLVFPSMPEVMRLNKVGGFTMASLGQSKSVVSEFMKKKKADDGSSFEEAMLKLLRTLPK